MRRESHRRFWPLLAATVTLAAFTLPAASATASGPRIVVASASPIPSGDTVVNQAVATSFDVVLVQPDQAALSSYIASLSNTASTNYHHYLTTAQFAQRFGASAEAVRGVRSYFSRYGLHVGALSKGRIVLHVSGSENDVAHAFDASVATVRSNGAALSAKLASRATLPVPVARDVASVVGLSSLVEPTASLGGTRIESVVTASTCPAATGGAGPTSTTPNSLGGYTVQQQAQLYGLSGAWASGDTGVGQVIGIYELGAYDPSDLATFDTCYALTPTIDQVSVDGGASGTTYSDEATTDVEEAVALAPGATIEVYAGPNSSTGPLDVYQQMADDDTATVISTSWGDCETDPSGDVSGEQPIFEQMAAQGQTVVSAAGDSGSSDCAGITGNAAAVDDPASQPYVTGVGALSVSHIDPLAQSVWNDGKNSGGGASGGGMSQIWSRPGWQSAPGISADDTMRMVPDLSVMGDPATGFIQYYTGSGTGPPCRRSCSGGWGSIGGTSIGAPLVSALVATAAQTCGVSRLGFINPALYAMASAGTGFVDVTTGSNDLYGIGEYSAGPGYDMASGLGSPDGAAFLAGLCPSKLDASKSSFVAAATTTAVPGQIDAQLRDVNDNPIADAPVLVSASGGTGTVTFDEDPSSATGAGSATYDVTTNATGDVDVDVTSSSAGPLKVEITYAGVTVYSTTLNFASASASTTKRRPGAPTIAKLSALSAGFKLTLKAPSSDGGSPIIKYEYSTDGGATWTALPERATSVSVTKLKKAKSYKVVARALNAAGAGPASKPVSVKTRT
jgi:subtilase family serine protease